MRVLIFFPAALTVLCLGATTTGAAKTSTDPVGHIDVQVGRMLEVPSGPVTSDLKARTSDFVRACRIWTQHIPASKTPPPAHLQTTETRTQFNLCQMAVHPEEFHAALRFYTILGAWGILLNLGVGGYLCLRIARAAWGLLLKRKRRATLNEV